MSFLMEYKSIRFSRSGLLTTASKKVMQKNKINRQPTLRIAPSFCESVDGWISNAERTQASCGKQSLSRSLLQRSLVEDLITVKVEQGCGGVTYEVSFL
jgi:hypothetical protein